MYFWTAGPSTRECACGPFMGTILLRSSSSEKVSSCLSSLDRHRPPSCTFESLTPPEWIVPDRRQKYLEKDRRNGCIKIYYFDGMYSIWQLKATISCPDYTHASLRGHPWPKSLSIFSKAINSSSNYYSARLQRRGIENIHFGNHKISMMSLTVLH